jgi:hypothetical protein
MPVLRIDTALRDCKRLRGRFPRNFVRLRSCGALLASHSHFFMHTCTTLRIGGVPASSRDGLWEQLERCITGCRLILLRAQPRLMSMDTSSARKCEWTTRQNPFRLPRNPKPDSATVTGSSSDKDLINYCFDSNKQMSPSVNKPPLPAGAPEGCFSPSKTWAKNRCRIGCRYSRAAGEIIDTRRPPCHSYQHLQK